jgi:hypothetical protein
LKLNAPFIERPLMDYLLKYSDFHAHKEILKKSNKFMTVSLGDNNEADDVSNDGGDNESQRMDLKPIGKVELNTLKSNKSFLHIVDPMYELQDMDLFLTDDPQESIWCQPLLKE